MGTAEGNRTILRAGLLIAAADATAAFNLADQKNWTLFFQKPLRTEISNNVYLNYASDTNYFEVDTRV